MDGSDVLRSPPHLRKERLFRQLAATPLIRLKGLPRSASPLFPFPALKQTVDMSRITSLPRLWPPLRLCVAAQVAAERETGNHSPGNSANPGGRARMAG